MKTGRCDLSTITSWQSSTIKRVARSTLAAEEYAVSGRLESVPCIRHLLTEARMARSPLTDYEKDSLKRTADVFTDSDSTGNANKKRQETMNTKNLTETIITKYNTEQLVDNMNKNKVLHIIFLALVDEDLFQLIKEKFEVKAEVEDDFIERRRH